MPSATDGYSRLDARRQEQTPQALARIVVVGLFVALWLLLFVAGLPMPVPFLIVLLLEIAFFMLYLRTVAWLPTVRSIDIAQYVMLGAEIVFHTTIVYFLGGLSWLGAFAYVFGLIFSNTFLDLRRGAIYTTGAVLAFTSLILLEATGVIPHQTYLAQGPLRYTDTRFVATSIIGGMGVFYSIYLWVNWVGYQLRQERDAAVRAQEGLLEARAELQRANEELEERVRQRTAEIERVNAALRENEARLRTVIENAPVVLFALDREGIFTLSEGSGLDALGLAPGEVVGSSVYDVYAEVPAILENIRRALDGESFSATVDLGDLSFETHYAPLRDDEGAVSGLIGIATDVSDRRQAQRALEESEQRLQLVVDTSPDPISIQEVSGRYRFVNSAYKSVLGYDSEQLIGETPAQLIHPDDFEEVAGSYAAIARSGQPAEATYRFCHADGHWVTLESNGQAIVDEDGNATAVVVVSRDITERKRAEEALRALKRQNELILESAGEGIYGIDLDGRATFVNPAAARMVGWEPADLLGDRLHDVLHHSHADGTPYDAQTCPIYAAFHDGKVRQVSDEVFWRKDGTSFPIEYISTPIRDEDGTLVGAVVTFNDITERKQAEEALREYQAVLTATVESTEDGILVVRDDWQVAYANERFRAICRLPEELSATTDVRQWLDRFVAQLEDPQAFLSHVQEIYGTRAETFDSLQLKDGRVLEQLSVPLELEGKVVGRVVSLRDVTERKRQDEAVRESENKFRTMAETVAAAVFIFQGTKVRYVNSSAEAMTGFSRSELLEMDFWEVIHPEYRELVRERGLARQRGADVPQRYEVKIQTKERQNKWVEFAAGLIDYEGRRAVLGTAFDITERKRAEEALREHANRDPLTGLLNRRAGLVAIEERLEQAKNTGREFAVLVLDLDKFKSINDSFSHEQGDAALLLFADVLNAQVGDRGVICRLGGDEFEIGLDDQDVDGALAFADELQDALRSALDVADGGNAPRFAVSIGVACHPEDGASLLDLGRHADQAMYAAKAQGGDGTRAWRETHERAA